MIDASKKTFVLIKMTSNGQLDNAMRGVKGFLGTKGVDEIPQRLRKGQSLIINLQKSTEGGSHWVCARALDDGRAFYFDSYGGNPDDRVLAMLKRTSPRVVNNTSMYQKKDTDTCGHFCVFVLKHLANGTSLYDVLYKHLTPDPSARNERAVGGAVQTGQGGGALHRADALPENHIIKIMKAFEGDPEDPEDVNAFFTEIGDNGMREIARLPAYDLIRSDVVFLGVGKKSKRLNTLIVEAKRRYDHKLQRRNTPAQ